MTEQWVGVCALDAIGEGWTSARADLVRNRCCSGAGIVALSGPAHNEPIKKRPAPPANAGDIG